MHSPPVQPIRASRSGIGAVATMSLETTTSRRCSSRTPAAQALVAITSRSAATSPRAVRTYRRHPAVEPRHAGVLVDPHAELEADAGAAPAPAAPGWMVAALGSSTPARCCGDPAAPPRPRRREPMNIPGRAAPRLDGRRPRHPAGTGPRRPQPAALRELGVDAVPPGDLADLVDRVRPTGGRPRSRRPCRAASRATGTCAHQESTNPPLRPRGAAAADVALEHDHVAAGIPLLQPVGRPQADEAAADDAHVGGGAAGQRRRVRLVAQRLVEPQRPVLLEHVAASGAGRACESAVCVIGPPWYRAAVCRGRSSRPQGSSGTGRPAAPGWPDRAARTRRPRDRTASHSLRISAAASHGPRRLVRPLVRERVEHVGEGDDAAADRDRLALQPQRDSRCRPTTRDGVSAISSPRRSTSEVAAGEDRRARRSCAPSSRANSSARQSPGLSSIASGTASLPMSCSGAASRISAASSGRAPASAISPAVRATRSGVLVRRVVAVLGRRARAAAASRSARPRAPRRRARSPSRPPSCRPAPAAARAPRRRMVRRGPVVADRADRLERADRHHRQALARTSAGRRPRDALVGVDVLDRRRLVVEHHPAADAGVIGKRWPFHRGRSRLVGVVAMSPSRSTNVAAVRAGEVASGEADDAHDGVRRAPGTAPGSPRQARVPVPGGTAART